MRGRKPKPVELRVLHGGARDKALAAQPKPRRVLPRCPEYVPEGPARDEWKRLARELYDAGLLTAIDRNALGAYCVCFARWVEAEAKLKENDGPVIQTRDGNDIQSPYLSVANRALEQMSKLAAEFGMTPSSRTRVKAEISAAKQQQSAQSAQSARERPARRDDADDPRRALG